MVRPALTDLSEEERLFRTTVRAFAEERLRPLAAEMDREGKLHPEVVTWLFELGLMGIEVSESWGGAGATFFISVLAIEELARVDPSVAVVCDVQNTLVINAVRKFGNSEQQKRLLGKLAGGSVGAYALSEAGSGSDAFALACRAEARGSDFAVTGRKLWVTNGGEAELFLVFATVDPGAGYKGITCFVVERGMAGFSVPRKEDKLGIRASSTCELVFDGVVVPRANVLGVVGKGYKVAIETLNAGRIGIAGQMVGLAQGAFEGALAYVQQREQFGHKIAEFQAVRHRLARAAIDIEAARLLTYNAARLHDAGQSFVREAAMAKWFASDAAERVASECLELYGGVGFTKECPAEKFLRDAKIGKIYEGTSFVQLDTIARLLF
ncbi:MAG: Acyl-CoA dehydrogenase [Deltaproteobacteria bacterium]|nr:Acyl-CoA dehydrogenase [Deltaproteobacteria bacterium]